MNGSKSKSAVPIEHCPHDPELPVGAYVPFAHCAHGVNGLESVSDVPFVQVEHVRSDVAVALVWYCPAMHCGDMLVHIRLVVAVGAKLWN